MLSQLFFLGCILASASAITQCDRPTSTICNATILACCDANFREALQALDKCDGKTLYNSPNCASDLIESTFLTNAVNGVFKICNAFNLFRDCLDVTMRSCTNAAWFIQNRYTLKNAKQVQALYTRLNFQCGAGLDAVLNNDKCMVDAINKNQDQFKQCNREFYNNIYGDPYHACDYLERVKGCYEKPLLSACGTEAGWWACEFKRLQATIDFPQCTNLFCTAIANLS
jgi:hypothetical protein